MNGRTISRLVVVITLGAASMFGSVVTVKVLNTSVTPFQGYLNNSSVMFVCDDNNDSVTAGESWYATETTLSQVIGDIGPPTSNSLPNSSVPNSYFGQAM